MKRPWLVWVIFGLCLAVVLAAMGWISLVALRSEQAEATANARAEFEEDVRLALWNMDDQLKAILVPEMTRPYFAFGPPDLSTKGGRETLVTALSPHVLLHFRFGPEDELTSPLAITDAALLEQLSGKFPREMFDTARQRLEQFRTIVTRGELAQRVPRNFTSAPDSLVVMRELDNMGNRGQSQLPGQFAGVGQAGMAQSPGNDGRSRRSEVQQTDRSNVEYLARQENFQRLVDTNRLRGTLSLAGDVRVGEMRPVWIGENLLLARWVRLKESEHLQGVWLDWPNLKAELLASIADKFPLAELRRVETADEENLNRARMLAGLPLEFDTMASPIGVVEPWSPIRASLAIAWGCVLLAASAVAALLLGVLRLSERRAAFVSAVTHELRTPLTTFRMYSDMLARGMVSQPEKQAHYLNTLRVESDRLTHLVANVLSYARLERGRPVKELQTITVGELISQTQSRLRDRASQGGLELRVTIDPSAAQAAVRCDPSVVEQILFNLVDNACKYAASGQPPVVELSACQTAGAILVRVRDHGPGIAAGDRRRIFRTFGRSAHQAAGSAPGVGLGLGLSRRLARAMGGDLRLDPKNAAGAAFVLTLRGHH